MNATNDFADWLSPMLVKELRQGMRSRLFVISFLLLQVAMIVVAILGLFTSARQQSTSDVTAFFWIMIGGPLLLIMPISGLNAVGNERKANTLELLFLTRLTARRILAGKWLAIVAQTVLLVCAVLPYAVLRYFLGGVNIGNELTTIGVLLFASALLSGITVCFSPQSSALVRVVLAIIILFLLQILPRFLFGFGMWGHPVRSSTNWQIYLSLAWVGLLTLLLVLEFGASKIAPAAENHSTSRRLIGLIILCGIILFGGRDLLVSPLGLGSIVLLGSICIGAVCESPSFVPTIYQPFARFGLWGKLAGRFLYPGWPSGVLFSLMALVIAFAVIYFRTRGMLTEKWILWYGVAVAGTLYFPAALLRLVAPRSRHPLVIYLGIQTVLALLVVLAASLGASNVIDFRPLIAIIPTCGLLLSGSEVVNDGNILEILICSDLITAASLVCLFFKMGEPWREIRTLEKAAATLPLASTINAAEHATAK